MRYEYANEAGEVRVIEQRMTDEHPAAIRFNKDGTWYPYEPRMSLCADDDGTGTYHRVFGNIVPAVLDDSFTKSKRGSAALPKNIDPKLCPDRDHKGRPIVRNYAHAREIERATGFVLE